MPTESKPKVALDRFTARYEVNANGCWIWQGSVRGQGYGQFYLGEGQPERYAHRLAYLLFRGDIPEGLDVCHRCDVRLCVNPDHLFLGTRKDNIQDASQKGRLHLPHKLSWETIAAIQAADPSESHASVGRRLGVSTNTAWVYRKRASANNN